MKIYVEVYGCTANKSDASIIKGLAEKRGHKLVEDADDADAVVLLTCTVIGSTEQRMLHRIKKLDELKKTLVVSGCMASVQPDLIKKISENSLIVPPQNVSAVIDLLEGKKVTHEKKITQPRYYQGVIAPIAVSEGCIYSCSYCITTKARGKLLSYPAEEIAAAVEDAVNKGCVEIQLTAQDFASYGLDNGGKIDELINRICETKKDFKVRIGMMNPRTVLKRTGELIKVYSNRRVYRFLHLPVQSGDNDLLKKMNRGYTAEDFIELVSVFRSRFPDITLSTDVIVGFPGEDDDAFIRTVKLLEMVEPDIVNITRFSPRPYTEAKKLKNKVPTSVAKERSRILTKLCKEMAKKQNEKYVGGKCEVIVTEEGKGPTNVGRTNTYKPVVVPSNTRVGSIVKVKVVDATPTHLIGKLI